jgi:hypothetical protein
VATMIMVRVLLRRKALKAVRLKGAVRVALDPVAHGPKEVMMTTAKVQAQVVHRKEAVRVALDPVAHGLREVMMTTAKVQAQAVHRKEAVRVALDPVAHGLRENTLSPREDTLNATAVDTTITAPVLPRRKA